ncbi:MAG: hypothetical protein IKT51_01395, partial [Phascolarctobacterium sp.]|nr:hypothetical protein [Phascolarctobacterium sp.]
DKLITRYEMAQIVAKAMAKGADCDKLAAEFADELDTLGVRVAKLEKGADNVKITGQIRADYRDSDSDWSKTMWGSNKVASFRTRLWVEGQVNEDWSVTAMFQNTQNLRNFAGEETTSLKRIYTEGKIGGVDVLAGRWNEFFYNANILDDFVDGARFTYGDKVKVSAIAGKLTNGGYVALEGEFYAANVATKVGVVDAAFNYFNANKMGKEVYNVNLGMDVAKDLHLAYEYMWGSKDNEGYNDQVSKDGWVARLDYKGADASVPGSYGVHAQWFDQPVNAFLSPTTDATQFTTEGGYEGYNLGVDYTLAKNIQLCVNYYDTEAKIGKADDEVLYSELYFFF